MSAKTTKYNFIKPESADAADIEAANSNWDKLDTELYNINENINTLTSSTNLHNLKLERLDTLLNNKQSTISSGTSKPSGGKAGDVYIQIIE